ncbi:MAG: hypothetical protein IKL27_08950 [Oscillospiraceae bacterium]|nr:hypothetical protein [Oscillospiraceae bacterium]
MSELIILCRPEELDEAHSLGYRLACAGWQVGKDGRLWRSPMPKLSRGSLMTVLGGKSGERLQDDITAECARLGIDEVLWLDKMRSTAISGGNVSEYLKGETDVFVEPMRHYFTLPSNNGNGVPINEAQLEKFKATVKCRGFSRELGCKYLIWEGGCVLYDDAESIGRKIKLLRDIDIKRIILPYSSKRVREFLRVHL